MKGVLAGAIALAGVGVAVAQPSPNAFVFWNLMRDANGASLVSDRDYHRPESLRVTFSCTPGVKKITVREYLNDTDRVRASLPLSRRDRLKITEGCDGQCERHSDAAIRDYVARPGDLPALRPKRFGEASISWNGSTKKLIDRYLFDPTQFGDARPASVQSGLARQRNLLSQFQSVCGLK